MALVDWMKLGGTEDDEETVVHAVPFGPRMLKKTYKQAKVNQNTKYTWGTFIRSSLRL